MTRPTLGASGAASGLRCAAHPSRPAVDSCPVCARPRCGTDADTYPGGGCPACKTRGEADDATASTDRALRAVPERVIAGALVAFLLGLVGAVIASEYVGAQGFAEIVPFLVGLGCAAAAAIVARTGGHGRVDVAVRSIGALAAVLATAFSFRLVPGGQSPFTPIGDVGPPYLAALAGAAASRFFR